MKKICLSTFILFLSIVSFSQSDECDGNRYLNNIFPDLIETTDVVYGNATTLGGNNLDLAMDVYEPEGDELEIRPLIVFVHGGGFIGGTRSDMELLCTDFAQKGYVTATISYRLLDAIVLDSIGFTEEVVCAVSDTKAAIRYFREDAATTNQFKIDPDRIFIGGISAGAVTCCHVAYLDSGDDIPGYVQNHIDNHGGLEGESSNNTEYSSDVQGVLNYSGGLLRPEWIDANEAPLYSAHDDGDEVVSCGYGTSNLFFFELYNYGGCILDEKAEEVGLYHDAYIVPNSTAHVGYFMNTTQSLEVLADSYNFIYNINCDLVNVEESIHDEISIFPNPSKGLMKIDGVGTNTFFKIYNQSGELCGSGSDRILENKIDLRELASGSYLIQILEYNSKAVIHSQHIIIE